MARSTSHFIKPDSLLFCLLSSASSLSAIIELEGVNLVPAVLLVSSGRGTPDSDASCLIRERTALQLSQRLLEVKRGKSAKATMSVFGGSVSFCILASGWSTGRSLEISATPG